MINVVGSHPQPPPEGWEQDREGVIGTSYILPPSAPGKGRGRRQAGLTLIELLLALALGAILVAALGFTFMAAANLQKAHAARIASQDQTSHIEDVLSGIIKGSNLTTTATDTTSFFQGLSTGGQNDLGAGQLTLTTTAPGVPMSTQTDDTNDFETQQTLRGPIGGVSEVSLSTTSYGDSGGRTGLFERIQHPSDGDPTQGGMESVLTADIGEIGFQFWNGQQWISAWDTTLGDRRLPAAVQVSYTLAADTQRQVHMFVVTIPESDVTVDNPDITQGTS